MIILGVDTSTDSLAVSLIDEKRVLAECNVVGKLRHSSLLMPTIAKAVKKIKAKIADIDLYSIGLGPGSFTGLRVGITAMRAMAIALEKPILGIPTLDAIARNGLDYLKKKKKPNAGVKICPVLDAKKNKIYACIYRWDNDNIVRETDYLLEPAAMLVKRLKGEVLFLGDAIPLYREELLGKKALRANFMEDEKWFPKGSVIAKMALAQYQTGRRDNPYKLVPMYLHARDCQVRYDLILNRAWGAAGAKRSLPEGDKDTRTQEILT